ncbi:hypothetical protein B7463_g1280, partial [Scytalidium lignicola]
MDQIDRNSRKPLVQDFESAYDPPQDLELELEEEGNTPSFKSYENLFVRESKSPRLRRLVLIVITITLASWGLVDLLHRCYDAVSFSTKMISSSSLSSKKQPCWCGNSDKEAIAMGCRYDHIAVDWLPDHCIDDELSAEFDRAGPGPNGSWAYFTKGHGNETISNNDIDSYARAGTDYFATRKAVEPWNDNEEHITHCEKYILKTIKQKRELGEIETRILGKARH